jgi:hypothetical protein
MSAITDCLAAPHIIHMVVVVFGALLFIQSILEVVSVEALGPRVCVVLCIVTWQD